MDKLFEKPNGQKAIGDHRLLLWRNMNDSHNVMLFIMLNPSTADDEEDDPTTKKCRSIARQNGYDAILITNLFSYRASTPDRLIRAQTRNLPESNGWLRFAIKECNAIVVAWGARAQHSELRERMLEVLQILEDASQKIYYLGSTKKGYPRHPRGFMRKTDIPALNLFSVKEAELMLKNI